MTTNEVKPNNLSKSISEVLEIGPKELASLIQAGHFYYEQGRLKEALDLLEGISVLDSFNPYVHAILGSIYQKQKRFDESVASYTRALDLFPDDICSLTNRGEVYLGQGKLQEAVLDFERAILLDTTGKHPAANRSRFLAILTRDALGGLNATGI